ncbi:MAG: YicC family protein [Rhodothermales bacterium]|nr:YicC family protein [Rhodothermales bacterium]MDG2016993.1 YicC family protein [Rhodothermales bacterium]HAY36591.1 YicC family protein [Bacteroidota bacterium]
MIASMTGFGRGESEVGGYTATAELRSVNSRFCEVNLRTPRSLADKDGDIQRIIKDAFARGRFSVSIQIEEPVPDAPPLRVNQAAVAAYRSILEEIKTVAGIKEPIRLEQLLRYSDILEPEEKLEDQENHGWAATKKALEMACKAMRDMRLQEGLALQTELEERLHGIEKNLREGERLAPLRVESASDRLKTRLAEILGDGRIDPDRLEFEMAMLADKLDVREECVRLDSHLLLFREAIASGDPVGRKLNFLAQEMNREINTIGSKSNDAEMAHLVVGMKEELEKIREQVENVE